MDVPVSSTKGPALSLPLLLPSHASPTRQRGLPESHIPPWLSSQGPYLLHFTVSLTDFNIWLGRRGVFQKYRSLSFCQKHWIRNICVWGLRIVIGDSDAVQRLAFGSPHPMVGVREAPPPRFHPMLPTWPGFCLHHLIYCYSQPLRLPHASLRNDRWHLASVLLW